VNPPIDSELDDLAPLGIPTGTMLGRFEVLRKLATGGMAEIYLARLRGHAGFEKLVVIKRISPEAAGNPKLIQMFLDEARLVATLQHPNIADVYEVGEYRGAPFFAMEHLHGRDVRSIRKAASERNQGVPLRMSLAIIHATATALDYAHARSGPDGRNLNLVHRDISPSNIVVSYEGAIKLIDFGVARVTGQTHTTQAGTVRGKCPYMSPEQCRGLSLDGRSDLFSLGSVLYELTVGRRPFVGLSDFEIMSQIVNADVQRPSTLTEGYPGDLERIVMKLLARDPVRRHQSAEELLHELEPFLDANHLWVPPKKLSRYMRSLFSEQVIAWEKATHGDTETFADHIAMALSMEAEQDTPPMPVQVVMRLAQEMEAVALDEDASLALAYRPDDPDDPLHAIFGPDQSVAVQPSAPDTVTVRTGESDMFDSSVAHPSGDTVTVRTGEPEQLHDSVVNPSGDTVTTPWEEREAFRGQRADTVPQDGTNPGWIPPPAGTASAKKSPSAGMRAPTPQPAPVAAPRRPTPVSVPVLPQRVTPQSGPIVQRPQDPVLNVPSDLATRQQRRIPPTELVHPLPTKLAESQPYRDSPSDRRYPVTTSNRLLWVLVSVAVVVAGIVLVMLLKG
jgi:serine/threonine protein kinase